MKPEEIDVYELNGVSVSVHSFKEGNPKYWITAGVGSIEVKEEEITSLYRLLKEFNKEVNPHWLRKLLLRKR